jgi:MFS family permease
MMTGLTNMVARIVTGRFADSFGHLETFAVSMTMAGMATAMLPLLTTYASLVVYAVFFGYFGGAFVGLYSVVTADYFGTENLPTALGCVMCSWCIGAFIGAPLSGWIYDAHGSYTPAWILCGVSMSLSGVCTMALPVVDRMYPDRLYRPVKVAKVAKVEDKVEGNASQEATAVEADVDVEEGELKKDGGEAAQSGVACVIQSGIVVRT